MIRAAANLRDVFMYHYACVPPLKLVYPRAADVSRGKFIVPFFDLNLTE